MASSISSLAIKAMFWRILIVVTCTSIGGYWYNYEVILERTTHDIGRYVKERIERESIQFDIAEKNLKLLSRTFYSQVNKDLKNIDQQFSQLIKKYPDGTYRTKSRDPQAIQVLIPLGTHINSQVKKNIVVSAKLMEKFGSVWSSNFLNVWMAGIENYGITYWPSEPGMLLNVPADFKFIEHEYMTVGLPKNNPSGKQRWAGPYLDVMSNDWMITLNQPVYLENKYQLSFGMDIILEEFNLRSTSNLLKGSYNIIFNKNGRLIVHPKYMDKIMASNGRLFVNKSGDEELKSIFKSAIKNKGKVIYQKETKLFLGVGQIRNMDWYFVLVYPESNLKSIAGKTALFVAIMGLISLIIEMLMLSQVLRKYVTTPIANLVSATNLISQGNFQSRAAVSNEDEIGQLANSFNSMAKSIEERDHLLSEHSSRLEAEVAERSRELDLQRAKAVEASKMATLGEISAGIAHEINNPLSIISLSSESLRNHLRREELDREKLDSYASKIEKTIERISKIIRGLKSFSRNSHGDSIKPVPLNLIIENTLVLCEENLKQNNIQLISQPIPEVLIKCRESDLLQTMVNLIQNAIDALQNQAHKEIGIFYVLEGETISILVEDSGAGIPDEVAEKIMNPFFTTKEVGKGTGLGLFISSGLIHANGGRLFLDRKSSKTRFVIALPITPA